MLPLDEYDRIIVSYSGGKDSLAVLLDLFDRGVSRDRIELWHQAVDGEPGTVGLMDWGCTEAYVRATAAAEGLPVRFQWKDGGFEGEMLREDSKTRGVWFEDGDGVRRYCPPGASGKASTRLKFPQVSADLSVRWCSPYLKIDVASRAITNDPRFAGAKVLMCTGERRQESVARSKYKEWEPHRSGNKSRVVHQWRSVIDWTEQRVWEAIERHGVRPHPAYYCGYGRVSCMKCIFGGPDEWASSRHLDPAGVQKIADYETRFGSTIKKGLTVLQQADRGTPFPELAKYQHLATGAELPAGYYRMAAGEVWERPAGAYKRCSGPT